MKLKLGQIVGGTRKVFSAVELGHRDERSVEGKAATMVSASQTFQMAFSFDHESSAMCANIRQAAKLRMFVRNKNERLVETAFEQCEWEDVSRRLYSIGVAGPLPAAREDGVFLDCVIGRIGVNRGGKRRRPGDILVDINSRKWRLLSGHD